MRTGEAGERNQPERADSAEIRNRHRCKEIFKRDIMSGLIRAPSRDNGVTWMCLATFLMDLLMSS